MTIPDTSAARSAEPSRPGWGVMLGWGIFFVLFFAGLALAVLDGGAVPVLLDSIN